MDPPSGVQAFFKALRTASNQNLYPQVAEIFALRRNGTIQANDVPERIVNILSDHPALVAQFETIYVGAVHRSTARHTTSVPPHKPAASAPYEQCRVVQNARPTKVAPAVPRSPSTEARRPTQSAWATGCSALLMAAGLNAEETKPLSLGLKRFTPAPHRTAHFDSPAKKLRVTYVCAH